MANSLALEFGHYIGGAVPDIIETVVSSLYVTTHADVAADPFYGVERFVDRVRGYIASPSFELVAAFSEHKPVGQAFGYALPKGARWWQGLTTDVDPDLIVETGSRTFALCELMVEGGWQGLGIAHALHDELLFNRPESRATLLVREDNNSAQRAYAKWGWKKIGRVRPFPDSPHFDALILDLPSS